MAEGEGILPYPTEEATRPTATLPSVNDVLFGRGNAINTHPGNQQFRALVDEQGQRYGGTTSKKEKRAIAEQIFAEMEKLHPPGRFLMEDPSQNTFTTTTNSETRDIITGGRSPGIITAGGSPGNTASMDVNTPLLKKSWSLVEREKALKKILHRLREKYHEQSTSLDSPPSPQVNVVSRLIGQKDESLKSNSASDVNPEDTPLQLNDPCEASMPSTEDWQLLHQQLQDFSDETCANRGDTELVVNLNEKDDIFIEQRLTPDLEHDSCTNLREYTLRQWIMSSKPEIDLKSKAANYTKSAICVALKLTECLLEAEKEEQSGLINPIPLASIAPQNVLIRTKDGIEVGQSDEAGKVIEFVWVMSFVGDDSATGGIMTRLFALGTVLFELFSTKELIMDSNTTDLPKMVSMQSIVLSNDSIIADQRSNKKSYWRLDKANDKIFSDSISILEANGVPWSLCSLVKNLLECRHGSMCEDDAYASLADLQVDLQLMLDNPDCFLSNLHFNNSPTLEVCDKLYGREEEITKLSELYKHHITGKKIKGAIISGGAGCGKSKLAMYMEKLTNQCDGYFLSTKFEQNQNDVKPLSTMSKLFNSLCEVLFNDCSRQELKTIEEELTDAIGSSSILLEVVPSLKKLMPSSERLDSSAYVFVDSSLSMTYQLSEFMRVISSHSKPITMFIDDLQFADSTSLRLVGNLCPSTQGSSIFFIFCHRDDEDCHSGSFNSFLNSISLFSLETMKLETITLAGVNNLISETLRLSPRITRPLSSVLYRKTSGNPLFLRQLLHSLAEQRCIYFDAVQHRWAWDINEIMEMEISESVVAFLMKQIKRLPNDLQFGLQCASCIGTNVTEYMLDYLLKDLGNDLTNILWQACQEGFMVYIADAKSFRFAHDKIQEAVYEMIPEQQRRENHMQFGLSLCTHVLTSTFDNLELFFVAVNQINQGGPTAVHDSSQKSIIAQLNLKAGRRSLLFSDCATAFKFFQHGISFLGEEKWIANYELSLELYDAVSDAGFVLNQIDAVRLYSDEVLLHARCFDDKLHCMCSVVKVIATQNPKEAMDSSFEILLQCNEVPPRTTGDDKLRSDIDQMSFILQSISEDSILNMKQNNDKKTNTIINLYANLSHFMQYFKPWLLGSICLRMVELTINTGMCSKSSIGFAYFGGVLVSIGYFDEGRRLGKLALKLAEQKSLMQEQSIVISIVYDTVFWAFEPLQSIVECHMIGYKVGQQSGDIVVALKNLMFAVVTNYFAGQNLDNVLLNVRDFIIKIGDRKIFLGNVVLLLSQTMVLQDGPDATRMDTNLPSEKILLADPRCGPSLLAYGKVHHLIRAFLFRQMFDATLHIGISETVAESSHLVKIEFAIGYFFEGLSSFQLERLNKSGKWIERGRSALERVRCWSEHSSWNWENKLLLLEAENKYTEGDIDFAAPLYDSAIRSAHEHKFIHEEAIASELAGAFYHERGLHQTSYPYFMHSIKCFKQWGAHAVAQRVEAFVQRNFRNTDVDLLSVGSSINTSLDDLFSSRQGSKKRSQGEGC